MGVERLVHPRRGLRVCLFDFILRFREKKIYKVPMHLKLQNVKLNDQSFDDCMSLSLLSLQLIELVSLITINFLKIQRYVLLHCAADVRADQYQERCSLDS